MRSKINVQLFAVFAAWTAVATIFASQSYVYGVVTGENKDWWRVFWWTFADWYIWAALSPAIFWFARQSRVASDDWLKPLVLHFGAAFLFSFAHLILQSLVQTLTGWSKFAPNNLFLTTFVFLFFKKIHLNLMTYAALVGISHAALFYRRYHERRAEAHQLAVEKHQLEAELARSQLAALQMQLNPHFLFNTLNTLSEMIHRDQKAADKMVARLGDLLRMSLEREAAAEVTLERELEFLRKYLEIEKLRFHDRLEIELDIEETTLDALVPNMILQPLVENAVKHGVSFLPGKRRIEIKAKRVEEKLRLTVRDDGAGLPQNWQADGLRERIGLSNTRRRLEQLYSERSNFELAEASGGGTQVSVTIPFRLRA